MGTGVMVSDEAQSCVLALYNNREQENNDSRTQQFLCAFFTRIENDPRISVKHIGTYVALLVYWELHHYVNPFQVFSYEIMRMVKMSTRTTYYKTIHELNDYGYIKLVATRKNNQGSKIYLFLLS